MKRILVATTLILLFFCGTAQPGSVLLRNGTGAPISLHGSLTDAFAAIPGPLSQSYIIEFSSSYNGSSETFPIALTDKGNSGPANTITIRPAAGSSASIIASVPGAPLIEFDGADYFTIDGRPGGTGSVTSLLLENTDTISGSHTISFRNGATYNTIRYCVIKNNTRSEEGSGVYFGDSPTDPSGNSFNRVEYCKIDGGHTNSRSNGSTTAPNEANTFYGDRFTAMVLSGSWYEHGTIDPNIDSCEFDSPANWGNFNPTGIMVDSLTDTLTITRNRFHDFSTSAATGPVSAILVKSVAGPHLLRIYNNFISLDGQSTQLIGINLAAAAAMYSEVYHNSIRIFGTLASGGTSGAVGSAALARNFGGITGSLALVNNAFVNERTGGTAGLQHVVLSLPSTTTGLTADFNTYNTVSGLYAKVGLATYNSMSNYIAALSGDEINSNDSLIQFISLSDLHLSPAMTGNTGLQGTSLTAVPVDIDNESRTFPYRGADESVSCGQPTAGQAEVADPYSCSGSFTEIRLNTQKNNYYTYQWQSSSDGVSFVNVPAGTDFSMNDNPVSATYYRAIVTCSVSSQTDTSTTVMADPVQPAAVSGISSNMVNTLEYVFTAEGVSNVTSYLWLIDNQTSSLASPTAVFQSPGMYPVMLTVANTCFTDTTSDVIDVYIFGVSESGEIRTSAYPNPVMDYLHISGAGAGSELVFIDAEGRTVLKRKVDAGVIRISTAGLTSGIYHVFILKEGRITAGTQVQLVK